MLRSHCESGGRDYDEIDKSVLSPLEISPKAMMSDDVVGMCEELAEIGINYVIFNMPNDHEIEPIETIGQEVIPKVTELR